MRAHARICLYLCVRMCACIRTYMCVRVRAFKIKGCIQSIAEIHPGTQSGMHSRLGHRCRGVRVASSSPTFTGTSLDYYTLVSISTVYTDVIRHLRILQAIRDWFTKLLYVYGA